MLDRALKSWAEHFNAPPAVVSTAPGRLNLIGEHTDYNEGYVLPAAIDKAVVVLASPAEQDTFASANIRDSRDHRGPGWRRYAYACRSALAAFGIDAPPIRALVLSNLPSGSGLSSSAALELALLGAWNEIAGLDLAPERLADLAWQAETRYVGVQCGKMDQMASALGQAGHAVLIDMRSLEWQAVPIPNGIVIAILDTRQSRALAASKYNERVRECTQALALLSEVRPMPSLRDATIEDVQTALRNHPKSIPVRRARHVVTENRRVLNFRDALISNDRAALSEISEESHRSLHDDYAVTTPQLDAMARAARAAPGCVCARMTGAGFGGACVALVEADSFDAFKKATVVSYDMYGFPSPNIFAARAAAGASSKQLT